MKQSRALRGFACGLLLAASLTTGAEQPTSNARPQARVMLLGLFHFDNPGLDAVKFTPRDVMQPTEQAYLAALAERIVGFAPTKVLLEYPAQRDTTINERYAEFRAGNFDLPRNEIYQLGFRVARLAQHERVYGFDVAAPPFEAALWDYLPKVPAAEKKVMDLITAESARLQDVHRTLSLRDILDLSNTPQEDQRNKGFYMLLNDVAAGDGLFYGADMSANWWHRNLRMYALVQAHAQPGERVLVIAGSGHTAILREFLQADAERVAENVRTYF